ncbi:MAG: malonyl-ACP O-methyltransferase BioC [Thermodesulfobacteriota bacterium]|nr:malonyl-ACP O-methyltransferase BioC [Thermodesulfobacteriota bacterium]
MIDKERVRQSFQRAAASYDSQAMIQHRVADHLLGLLNCHDRKEIHRVLEIGCCTGLLTRKLVEQCSDILELVLNDLVEGFAAQAGNQAGIPAISFLAGDIETIPLTGPFDLIISSSTFHWLHDLEGLLIKLADNLAPGAILAFSMYGPDNLQEIRQLTGIGLDYFSLQQVQAMVSKYFTLDYSDQQQEVFHFTSPREVLTHLRGTGVNAVSIKAWTRRRLQRFNREYSEKFSDGRKVRLSYHPLYIIAHR